MTMTVISLEVGSKTLRILLELQLELNLTTNKNNYLKIQSKRCKKLSLYLQLL